MRTPADIIALWPSIGAFAADIDVTAKHASQMKFRNSVPLAYWPRMVAAAAERGIDLDYEGLVVAHAQPVVLPMLPAPAPQPHPEAAQ